MAAKAKEAIIPNYPGPGKYNTLQQIGKSLVLSTSVNSGQPIINPISSKRFEEKSKILKFIFKFKERDITPGVGNYNVNIDITNGVYKISNCKSNNPI